MSVRTGMYHFEVSRTAMYRVRYVLARTSTNRLVLPCTRCTGFQMWQVPYPGRSEVSLQSSLQFWFKQLERLLQMTQKIRSHNRFAKASRRQSIMMARWICQWERDGFNFQVGF
jgi:hypothetical protein